MISIRTATEDDAEELLAIYAPYVKQFNTHSNRG